MANLLASSFIKYFTSNIDNTTGKAGKMNQIYLDYKVDEHPKHGN